ncbi:MAG: serine/threonine protein kinase [Deltaproteobacteria bacterium]|nr:serine/threonine protein kinase [Deltaproteobacteria bacterium]
MEFDRPTTGVVEESNNLKLSRNYNLMTLLGEGGMGKVYLGKTEMIGEMVEVAIKIFNKTEMPTPDSLDRFRREGRLLRRARHPNIVNYVDYWENEDLAYLVMDFVDGQDLEEYVQERGGRLPPEMLIPIIMDILSALGRMYEDHGMVHRDLKPGNIIVREKSDVDGKTILQGILIDFGNSKVIENEQNTSLTMVSGIMTGTPGYTAPGVSIDVFDQRDDVFSMAGTMMFGLLGTNKLEVPGDMNESMIRIVKQQYSLEHLEDTAIGHWIRINLNVDRYKRMSLKEALNSLVRIKDNPLAKVSERFVKVIASDEAIFELTEIADNAQDMETGDTLAIAIDKLGKSSPLPAVPAVNHDVHHDSEEHDKHSKSHGSNHEVQEENGRLPSMDLPARRERDENPDLAILNKVIFSDKKTIDSVKAESGKGFLIFLVIFFVVSLGTGFIFRDEIKQLFVKKNNTSSQKTTVSKFKWYESPDEVKTAIKESGLDKIVADTQRMFDERKSSPEFSSQLMKRLNAIYHHTSSSSKYLGIERSSLEKIIIISCETSAEKVFNEYTKIFLSRFKDLTAIKCDNSHIIFVRKAP